MPKKNFQENNKNNESKLVSKKTISLLQYRIKEEEQSSRLYLSMSLWLENEGYINSAKLWKKYSNEENDHANWARKYLLSFGILPEIPSLKKVNGSYKGLPDIIKKSFNHEVEITKQLQELANHALNIKDNMLYTLSEKYLSEQIEEHNKIQTLMDQLKSFGTNKTAMRLFDTSLKNNSK